MTQNERTALIGVLIQLMASNVTLSGATKKLVEELLNKTLKASLV